MPFASDKQRKWAFAAAARGDISKAVLEKLRGHTAKDVAKRIKHK